MIRSERRTRSAPLACSAGRSPRLIPLAHSSVSTRRPEAGQITAGTRKPGSRSVLAANSAAAAASMRRSSSPSTTPSKCADDRLGAQAAGEGREDLDHAGGEVEGVHVAQEGALDAGAQHLDRDGLAGGAQRGAVDLRQRGGGDRGLEVGEDGVERLGELVLDGGARLLHGKGRQLVLQHGELRGELGADHVRAGGEELAELDVGGPERGQRAQDRRLAGVALVAQPLEGPAEDAGGDAERGRRVEGLERGPHGPGALEGGARADQAPEVVRAPHRKIRIRASRPNAARRCPWRGCGSGPGRSRPRRSSRRRSPGPGSGGSIPRGTGSWRGRRRAPGRGAG